MRKLDEVVREYIIESLGADNIDTRYARILQIAISGVKDLNYDQPGLTKFKTIEVEDNDVALLPDDYIDYIRIGVCFNGSILALGENPIMCPPSPDDCGTLEVDQPRTPVNMGVGTYGYFFGFPWDERGRLVGRQWGLGGGNNNIGYYKVFPQEGFIALQNLNTQFDSIVLEYQADPSFIDGELWVHEYDVEAIKAWIYWKYIQRNPNQPLSQKEEARLQYGREKKKCMMRHNRFSANELMQVVRSGYKSSPKL